ncbi:arginine utilization protein RocB, partial [Staphylococcus xylosus]|nr:arginine utilization protein RocB [Staphylococcus xylosus]
MAQELWQTYEDRLKLLKNLVKHETVTNTQGEIAFPNFVKNLLLKLDYFQQHQSQVLLEVTEDEKEAVVAFYQAPTSKKTIVLISHFDTVGVEDFGSYSEYALDPDALKNIFKEN